MDNMLSLLDRFQFNIEREGTWYKRVAVARGKDLPILQATKNSSRFRRMIIVGKKEYDAYALYEELFPAELDLVRE